MRTRKSDGTRLLLTPAQSEAFDEDRDGVDSRNRALRFARSIGASDADFQRRERELVKAHGAGEPGDVFRAIANESVLQALKREEWDRLHSIYWGQARFLFEEGRPHIHLLRQAASAKLRGYLRSATVQQVVISTAGRDACGACARLEGVVFTIAEALEMMPIPHPDCEDGWCRCTWAPVTH